MVYTRRRELRLIDGQVTFSGKLLDSIADEVRNAGAQSNELFIPLLEAATLQYCSFKEDPDKHAISAIRDAVTDANAKLDAAADAVNAVFSLVSPPSHSNLAFSRWERHLEEMRKELSSVETSFDGERTPKNQEEIVFARKIGWAIDMGTNAKRSTSLGKLWDNLLVLLIGASGYKATNTAKILLKARKAMCN